jgi:hypothetical protein
MFTDYQRVRLKRSVWLVASGTEGTVLMIYDSPPPTGYEVEFFNAEGKTVAVLTVLGEALEAIG